MIDDIKETIKLEVEYVTLTLKIYIYSKIMTLRALGFITFMLVGAAASFTTFTLDSIYGNSHAYNEGYMRLITIMLAAIMAIMVLQTSFLRAGVKHQEMLKSYLLNCENCAHVIHINCFDTDKCPDNCPHKDHALFEVKEVNKDES